MPSIPFLLSVLLQESSKRTDLSPIPTSFCISLSTDHLSSWCCWPTITFIILNTDHWLSKPTTNITWEGPVTQSKVWVFRDAFSYRYSVLHKMVWNFDRQKQQIFMNSVLLSKTKEMHVILIFFLYSRHVLLLFFLSQTKQKNVIFFFL